MPEHLDPLLPEVIQPSWDGVTSKTACPRDQWSHPRSTAVLREVRSGARGGGAKLPQPASL